jgi:hypothetical protein
LLFFNYYCCFQVESIKLYLYKHNLFNSYYIIILNITICYIFKYKKNSSQYSNIFEQENVNQKMLSGDDQYRGSSSGSPPASLLVVPQPLTVKQSHSSHLNSHLSGPHAHSQRKYQCKMCPQVSRIIVCKFH